MAEPLPHTASYAKSARSTCKSCKGAISKGELRLGVTVRSPHFDGTFVKHMHVACYLRQKSRRPSSELEGFSSLRIADQSRVQVALGEEAQEGVEQAVRKSTEQLLAQHPRLTDIEANELEWRIAEDALAHVGLAEVREQLLLNGMAGKGEQAILRAFGAALVHGAVPKCPTCQQPSLQYSDVQDEWTCDDFASPWAQCPFTSPGISSLPRTPFRIAYTTNAYLRHLASSLSLPPVQESSDILAGIRLFVVGRIGRTKAEVAAVVQRHGAEAASSVQDATHVLASDNTFYKGSAALNQALELGLPCLSELFLDRCILEGRQVDPTPFVLSNEPKVDPNRPSEAACLADASPASSLPSSSLASPSPSSLAQASGVGGEAEGARAGGAAGAAGGAGGAGGAGAGGMSSPSTSLQSSMPAKYAGGELSAGAGEVASLLAAASLQCLGVALAQSRVDPAAHPPGTRLSVACLNPQYADTGLSLHSCASGFVGFDAPAGVEEKKPEERKPAARQAKEEVQQVQGERKTRRMAPCGRFSLVAKRYVAEEAGKPKHHLHEEDGRLFDVTLSQATREHNKFYRMQLLVGDKGGQVVLFTRWGRVGTGVGQQQVRAMASLQAGLKAFEDKFYAKTKNRWRHYAQGVFTKYGGAYQVLEMAYEEEEEEEKAQGQLLDPSLPSQLPEATQELVRMLFDKQLMEASMADMRLDTAKMPLGKLSQAVVRAGYAVLKEVEAELQGGGGRKEKLAELSAKFYTLVPHSFGMQQPPLLDSLPLLKEKMEMLETLADLEIAARLMKAQGGASEAPMNPLDAQYRKLGTRLQVLEEEHPAVRKVRAFVASSHSQLHREFGLEVEHVFEVQREGEADAYAAFQCLRNKKLLWHGSRLSNFVGILSQGLRIAPPEAPHSGYMFGKGIYFADMVSKSATYCHPHLSGNRILLLVSEVALGEVQEEAFARYLTKDDLAMVGKHSTKGLGRLAPASTGDCIFDPHEDTVLPLGKEAGTGVSRCELDHNEFIVYDTRQVRQRFLVQLRYKDL